MTGNFFKGSRCPKCAKISKTKTNEDFKREVFDLAEDEYTFLDEYKGANTKIKVRHNCESCGNYEYEVSPNIFLRGSRCPKCARIAKKTNRKTNEEFLEEVFDLIGDEYTFLEEYINATTKIKVRHNCEDCGNYEYEVFPNNFLKGSRCPKCAKISKTKTNDEFRKEVYDLAGDEYTFLEEYINATKKIKVRHNCEDCGNYEYEVSPNIFLRGSRCPKCSVNAKKSNDKFIKEVYDLVGDEYTFLEEYINTATKIKVRHNCEDCENYEYEVSPSSFLSGTRCPKCFGTQLKTNEEFQKKIFDLVGDEYTFLEEYINTATKIRIRHNCEDCGNYEYEVTPNSFLSGTRCPKCFGKQLKTNEEFRKEVFNLVGDEYTFLEDYKGSGTKIKVRHNCENCENYEYEVSPSSFLSGTRCPKCFGTQLKTNEEFRKEVFNLVGDEYIFIEEYKGTHTKIKVKHNCKSCDNYEYEVQPINFLGGNRCPKCNDSKGEKNISNYLDKNQVIYKREYKFDDCKYKNYLPFDFAILEEDTLKCLIEFDGIQHFKSIDYYGGQEVFDETKMRDNIKNTYCEENNIPLLRIRFDQIDNIDTILDNYLNNTHKFTKNHSINIDWNNYYSI